VIPRGLRARGAAGGDSGPPATALFGLVALGLLARRKVSKPTRGRALAKEREKKDERGLK
jgi:uncharacterized protein (TIGR03382 family)